MLGLWLKPTDVLMHTRVHTLTVHTLGCIADDKLLIIKLVSERMSHANSPWAIQQSQNAGVRISPCRPFGPGLLAAWRTAHVGCRSPPVRLTDDVSEKSTINVLADRQAASADV